MEVNTIVVVSLHSPKEKVWGQLIALSQAGITVRGIDLEAFDDFIRQVLDPEGDRVALPTVFYPMHRLERIALDEATGSIPSLSDTFAGKVGRSILDYLGSFQPR